MITRHNQKAIDRVNNRINFKGQITDSEYFKLFTRDIETARKEIKLFKALK